MKSSEDPQSLVETLRKKHAHRAACIDADAACGLVNNDDGRRPRSSTEGAGQVVDAHDEVVAKGTSENPPVLDDGSLRASGPRIVAEDLARECQKRRVALDSEARRNGG